MQPSSPYKNLHMGSILDTTQFAHSLWPCDSHALGNTEAINSLPPSGLPPTREKINMGNSGLCKLGDGRVTNYSVCCTSGTWIQMFKSQDCKEGKKTLYVNKPAEDSEPDKNHLVLHPSHREMASGKRSKLESPQVRESV